MEPHTMIVHERISRTDAAICRLLAGGPVYNPDVGSRADIVGEPRIYEGMYLVEVPYAKTTWICIAWRLFVWMVTAGLCVFGHG
ncbi:hypothetical protein [uncultured Muribaculum sp.]|uniref:hypothetical protein n=1 Tax=uncultured Muribaculum sp. TaxID=1918613 RepID=UPI0025B20E35|nr:hypothetical protein [uncultured Muribaculum sp.]